MVANCDVCGWLAAIGGMLAFGTFGVPIKSKAARSVDIGEITKWQNALCIVFWGVVVGCKAHDFFSSFPPCFRRQFELSDPLVMQTYKTTMCFLTSWIVLAFGEELTFTPWGIVSGLFW